MRIAVTSQNFRTVTGHAGRARRFLVFEADGRTEPIEVERFDLDVDMTIHGYPHDRAHPLDTVGILITGGAGEGFVRHLAGRGVLVVATPESDPRAAISAYFAGRVLSPSEACKHDHADSHDADHAEACTCASAAA